MFLSIYSEKILNQTGIKPKVRTKSILLTSSFLFDLPNVVWKTKNKSKLKKTHCKQ